MIVVAVLLSLLVQRALGWPGVPAWAGDLLLPMAFIVATAMLDHSRRQPYAGIAVGLVWDLLLEELVGPGGIAWGAAGMLVGSLAGVVADRRARSWAASGALGALVVMLTRELSLWPLGHATVPSALQLLRCAVLTGLWCGLVGWLVRMDLPARWRQYRARKLR